MKFEIFFEFCELKIFITFQVGNFWEFPIWKFVEFFKSDIFEMFQIENLWNFSNFSNWKFLEFS